MKTNFLILYFIVCVLLTGCGESGSSDLAPERPTGNLSGLAYDGPIAGGTVTAYRWDNGQKGEFVGSTRTDSKGKYSLDVKTGKGLLLLEITGGFYLEEASNTIVALGSQDKLSTLLFYDNGKKVNAQITHFTHWSKCLTEYLLDNSNLTLGNAVIQANEILSDVAQVPITATEPLDITNPENISANLTLSHQYGFLLAAISGVTAELSRQNNAVPHSLGLYTSIHYSSLVCEDIRHDGLMDGKGKPTQSNPTGQLFIGSIPLDVDTYRSKVAENILGIANTEANKVGFAAKDLLTFANRISLNRNSIYPNTQPTGVDLTPPAVIPKVAIGSNLAGEAILEFNVTDPLGVESIEFYIDGGFHQSGDVEKPEMRIVTNDYPDGKHEITVIATDKIGNRGTNTFQYFFLNTAPAINLLSSQLVNKAIYQMRGTVDSSIDIAQVQVLQGQKIFDAVISDNTWSASITLSAGSNTLSVRAIDTISNSNTVSYDIGFDKNPPLINIVETNASFSDGSGQLNLCSFGKLNDDTGLTVPVCLNTNNLHLGGKPISIALPNTGYVIAGFSVDDVSSGGLFTKPEDLLVEYRYLQAGLEHIGWATAPRQKGLLSNTVFIPFTTEYLGNNFYTNNRDTTHQLELRVKDSAGNSSTRSFYFKLDVIFPDLPVVSKVTPNLFTTPFSNREKLSGAEIQFTHTIDNTKGIGFFFRPDLGKHNRFIHHYHSVERENLGRYQHKVLWRGKHTFSASWVDLNFLLVGSSFQELKPAITYGDTAYFTKDKPLTVETEWNRMTHPNGVTCSRNIVRNSVVGDFWINGTNTPSCRVRPNGSYEVFLEERTISTYEPEEGYPRNRVIPKKAELLFPPVDVQVLNITENRSITPVNGWYFISQDSVADIAIHYQLPKFSPYEDKVSDLDIAESKYGEATLYDEQLEWFFDSELSIRKGLNPVPGEENNGGLYSTQIVGSNNTIYRIQ